MRIQSQPRAGERTDVAANTPQPADPTLDTPNLALGPDAPGPATMEFAECDDWGDDEDTVATERNRA